MTSVRESMSRPTKAPSKPRSATRRSSASRVGASPIGRRGWLAAAWTPAICSAFTISVSYACRAPGSLKSPMTSTLRNFSRGVSGATCTFDSFDVVAHVASATTIAASFRSMLHPDKAPRTNGGLLSSLGKNAIGRFRSAATARRRNDTRLHTPPGEQQTPFLLMIAPRRGRVAATGVRSSFTRATTSTRCSSMAPGASGRRGGGGRGAETSRGRAPPCAWAEGRDQARQGGRYGRAGGSSAAAHRKRTVRARVIARS